MNSEILSTPSLRQWDRQIRTFARHFLAHARLPQSEFTLLDVGCGTGSALAEIHAMYPEAKLFGSDLEAEHVDLSTRLNGAHGRFMMAQADNVVGMYDIIYISNVLEHVERYHDAVRILLEHCVRLYILVPFNELLDIKPKSNVPHVAHINSFTSDSLMFLDAQKYSVVSRIIRTPGAWGHVWRRELGLRAKAFLKREDFEVQREILFAVTRRDAPAALQGAPLFHPIRSAVRTVGARGSLLQ